ncbi:MAG: glycosyltransferase family 4 protein [bacterium]|nr:glycosyltransferase family 4 protein [bacterium]
MHIALDGNEANVANRVGSNVYAYQILKALEKLTAQDKTAHTVTVLLSQPPLKDLPPARRNWRYKVVGPAPLWTQFALPLHLFTNKQLYNIFFTPGHYAPRLSSIPYVSSVMDLAFLEYPEQFNQQDLLQLRDWTKYSVMKARKVITISQFSKKQIVKHYQREAMDIVVAYPAVHPVPLPSESFATDVLKSFNITSPYILYVGTLQPRKNLIRLIEAFELLHQNPKNKRPLQLVLAGKVGWLAQDILDKVASSPVSDRIVLTDYIDDEAKTALYYKAKCSVLIGLYEGFGIPPLESLQQGTVAVVSKSSSLPEVIGDAGFLVDPVSVKSIARGLEQAVNLSAHQRARLRKQARLQVQKFTWEATAKIIFDTLLEVASLRSN